MQGPIVGSALNFKIDDKQEPRIIQGKKFVPLFKEMEGGP
jgi:hypothetical protein